LSELPARTADLSTKQARLLPQEKFVDYLIDAPITDARRYFELARYNTRKHEKKEMLAAAIVGTLLGIWLGGGTWQGGIGVGILGFLGTLLLLFFIHWIHSPSVMYQAAVAQVGEKRARIVALEEQLQPNLLIDYRPEENEPFVQVEPHNTQYRVGVKSPAPISNAELVANHLKVGELPALINIHLRPMHERDPINGTKRVALKTDKEEYWDLISTQPAPPHPRGVVYLNCLPSFAGGSLEIPPGDYEFELMATGGERPPQTKIVTLKVDNNYAVTCLDIRAGRLSSLLA
jgi:hypothetical protein